MKNYKRPKKLLTYFGKRIERKKGWGKFGDVFETNYAETVNRLLQDMMLYDNAVAFSAQIVAPEPVRNTDHVHNISHAGRLQMLTNLIDEETITAEQGRELFNLI